MTNKQWTKVFHIAIFILFMITTLMVIVSSSNVDSLYINELNSNKTNNLYGSIVELDDININNENISNDKISTFEHIITEDMLGKYVVFYSYHSTVKASLISSNEEHVIYRLLTNDIFRRSASNNINFIKIPLDSVDKTLKIEIQGCYKDMVYPDVKFMYGEKFDFLVHYLQHDLANVIVETIMLLFSIVVCLVSIVCLKYKSSVLDMLYLGLFTLTFSVWCLTGEEVLHVVFQQPNRLLYIKYFCFYLTSVFLMLYIRGKTYGTNIKKSTITYTILIHLMIVVAMEVLQLLNIKDIRETVPYLHLAIVVEVLLVFRYSMYYINKNKDISAFEFLKSNFALCTILVTVIIAVIQFAFTSTVNPVLLCIAILIYVASLVIESITSLYKDILLGQQAKELKTIAYRDGLTSLKNRNAFISDTKDIDLEDLVIITFDLNNLKYYNDNFGHDKGDRLLIAMSDILIAVFGDNAYRIGGDEFEVIMYEKDIEVVNSLLLKFEQGEKEYNASNTDGIKVQAAYGYCVYDGDENHDITYMIDTADKRMYEHKRFLKGGK